DEALVAINEAVALSREETSMRMQSLAVRASILQRLNKLEASDNDLREVLRLIEEIRRKTLPQDIMKRGYAEGTQFAFGEAIEVRSRRGDARGSLEIAEQARSRAFLDLLASRRGDRSPGGVLASTVAMTPQNGIPAGMLAAIAPVTPGASA